MFRRIFGSEKAPQEGVAAPPRSNYAGLGTMQTTTTTTSTKVEDNKSSTGSWNISHSLPDLAITGATTDGNADERMQGGQQTQEMRINWPKDSLESVNESICSDPVVDQFQNKSVNVYRSAENLLGVEGSQAPRARRVFSLKKSKHHEQSEDFFRNNQSSSNSASLLSVDFHVNDILKSEAELSEARKHRAAAKEKAATLGHRSFMDLLHADNGSNPKKSKDSLNTKNSKRSSPKSRKRALTLTGTEFLKPPGVSKSPISEADGVQSEHDTRGGVLSRQMPEWRSSSVKATRTGKHSDVTTPSKGDLSARSARTPMINIPISKLNDHIVLALDGLEEDTEVQVVKVDASTLLFKPEELVTCFEDTWHIKKASVNLDCIAVLLPSSRHSSHSLTNLLPRLESAVKKVCIAKGSVALSRVHGTWSYSRFLFLTSEHLLIMKQKTMTTFKLKKRVAVSDLWLAPNLGNSDEVGSGSLPLSFIIGWPLATNYLFLFTKAEQKMMWLTLLERQISKEKQNILQNDVVIKITTQDTDCTMRKSLVVNPEETVFQVVQRYSKELRLVDSDPKHFELCVKTKENVIPLLGHETPFYIQLKNLREQNHHDKMPSQDHAAVAFEHFVLRPKKLSQGNGFRRRRARRLTLVGLFGKKSSSPQPDVLQSMPQPKLFGRNLSEVCLDDSLPKPIMDMLRCLYVHGPTTPGIFRKSGNHRDLLELKARLDAGEECNIDGLSIHVAASALKNWLRSLPDCLLVGRLYKQWIEVVCSSDSEKKSDGMKRLVLQLPNLNVLLLRYLICVLHRVGSHAQCNHMTSGNLAICLGPTILWPSDSAADLTSAYVSVDFVARVTQLLIDDAKQILGDNLLELFKGSVQEVPVDTELNYESEDSMGSHEVLNAKGDHENNASIESLDNYSFDDGLDTHSYIAVQSQMSIDSGLAVSNPRLNDEPDLPTIVVQAPSEQPRYHKRQLGTKKKAHTKSELSDISEAFPIPDAEERPNSKMAGASNVRQRVSRFQALKTHTDDSLSCGETFESSDDEFMHTSISSSENFVEVSSSFGDANSINDGTSREFDDHFESDDNRENNGPTVSEISRRALPAPVNAEQVSPWSLKKVDASAADPQKEADRPALALDQKTQQDHIGSGNEWYFMGPENDVQGHSSIRNRNSLPVKQKSNFETLNKTNVAEEVRVMQEKVFPKQYKPSSNSLRCGRSSEKQEHMKQPVKQISLDDAVVQNSYAGSSGEIKQAHAAKSQPVKVTLKNSDSSPLCLRLTGFEVLESQSPQKIQSSQDLRVESSVNSHNINSESSCRRPVRNKSVPRRLTDVAVNTSDSFFQSSRGVQTEPLDDQSIPRPVDKFRCTSLNLSGAEVNESKRRTECSGNKNQEENRPVFGTGRRFKSDLGLSPRRSWREEYADDYSDDALKAFSSTIQSSQTERRATRGRNYAFGQSVRPEEQFRSLSEESDHYVGQRQVRRASLHNTRSPREPTDYFDQLPVQNNSPVSIEQRFRDRRAVTVVTIGDTVNRSRISENKQAHQPTAAFIPEREIPISRTRNQRNDNRGSKTFVSDGEPLKSNVTEIRSNKSNQNSGSPNARDFAHGSSRTRPTYAINAPSSKPEKQSSSDTFNNSAASRHSSAQVRSQIPIHGMDDRGHKTDSQNLGASRNIDSASNQFHTLQQGNKFQNNFSVNRTPVSGGIVQRGSLKSRGEGRRDTSQNIDAAPNLSSRVTENPQKDLSMHDDSQRPGNARGFRGSTKPVVASHEFDIGKMVEATHDNSRINTTTAANADDSTITWSVNELRKRFDVALPNSRSTQQKSSVKKQ